MGALSSKDITANNNDAECRNKQCPERVLKDTRYDHPGYPIVYYNRPSSLTGTSSYSQVHYYTKPPGDNTCNRSPPSTVQFMDKYPSSTAQPMAGNCNKCDDGQRRSVPDKPSITALYQKCCSRPNSQLQQHPLPMQRPSSDYFCYKGREYLRCGKEDCGKSIGRVSNEGMRNSGQSNSSAPGCCQKTPGYTNYNPLTNSTGYRTHGGSNPPRRCEYLSPKEDAVSNLWNRLPPVTACNNNTPSLQALRQARGYTMPTLYYDCKEALRTLAILTYEIIRNSIVFCIILTGMGMRLCSEFISSSRTTKFLVLLTCLLFVLITLYVRRRDSPWYGEIC